MTVSADRIYLDYNASAPLLDVARTAMIEALSRTGNASSVHAEGRAARAVVEHARLAVADALAVPARQVWFTSGATEAANWVLTPDWLDGRGRRHFSKLYVSAIEHPCVLSGGRFAKDDIVQYPVTADGVADLTALESLLAGHDASAGAPLVGLMLANNETGVIQPVREAAVIVHAHGGSLVVDAVQGFGRMPFGAAELGIDALLVSAHKIGGPQGAGALAVLHPGLEPAPLIAGGGQEGYRRAGSENVAAIAGFGAAAAQTSEIIAEMAEVSALRDWLEGQLHTISEVTGAPAPVYFGAGVLRLPNTSSFAVAGMKAETALIALDLAGIAVSSGSACSSGKVRKSHVLAAMGADDRLSGAVVRVSIGPRTTRDEIWRFLAAWKDIVGRLAATAAAA